METRRIWLTKDAQTYQKWEELLLNTGLVPDSQLDYCIGIFDGEKLVATGGLYTTILKCIAVHDAYQSQNLLEKIVQNLREKLSEEKENHYFLYTKPASAKFFKALGFKAIVAADEIVLMEQGIPDFTTYAGRLTQQARKTQNNAAIVMNANPFTNGHRYLVEEAAKKSDTVYLFVLSEDRSLFDKDTRIRLVKEGVKDLDNVVVVSTEEYLVSNTTFPSYFLKDQAQKSIAEVQATLDAKLFKEKIAPILSINKRFVGEEPLSEVTEIYNKMMAKVFAPNLELIIIPRKEIDGKVISATRVRQLMETGAINEINQLVPPTTMNEILKNK